MRSKLTIIICFISLACIFGISGPNKQNANVQAMQDINPLAGSRNIIPPLKKKKLLAWLKAENYKEMFVGEPAVHSSLGPHGGNVRTYFNPILVEDLRAGKTTFRAGASMVKELYFGGQQQVIGYSVMVKVDDNSGPNAEGWLFYETFSGTNNNAFFGRSVPVCYTCHRGGMDYLLSGFRP